MFLWMEKYEEVFWKHKELLTSALILAIPDLVGDFMVYKGSSLEWIGIYFDAKWTSDCI